MEVAEAFAREYDVDLVVDQLVASCAAAFSLAQQSRLKRAAGLRPERLEEAKRLAALARGGRQAVFVGPGWGSSRVADRRL